LNRDPSKLKHIWDIEITQKRLKRESPKLYKKINSIIEDIPIVETTPEVNQPY